MFKPHYGKCKQCGESHRLIPTKRGLCQRCDREHKVSGVSNKISTGNGAHERVLRASNRIGNKSPNRKLKNNTPNNARTLSSTKKSEFIDNKRKPIGKLLFKKPRTSRKQPKATGELELFKKLYEERGPYSEVSGEYITFDIRCFSHILSKAAYKSYRLKPENIVLKTPQEHDMWHTQYHKLKHLPEWQWVLEKEQALKQKYYLENKIKKL